MFGDLTNQFREFGPLRINARRVEARNVHARFLVVVLLIVSVELK